MKDMAEVFNTDKDTAIYAKIDSFKNKLKGFLGGGNEAEASTMQEVIRKKLEKARQLEGGRLDDSDAEKYK